jgi:phytoene desaturase
MKKAVVIGAGFSGLSAACYLGKAGFDVTVLEKNESIGGRARVFKEEGFTFDMGPSWYWMPDIFEQFFADFGHSTDELLNLVRLDPSYRIYWEKDEWDIPAGTENVLNLFNQHDPGVKKRLSKFMDQAAIKYEVGMNDFVPKPSLSWSEFLSFDIAKKATKLDLLKPISKHIRSFTNHPNIIKALEFPVLFLGAKPSKTPALYSLMNYADIELGTWYPMGGMHEIIKAMEKVAIEQGVTIKTSEEVTAIQTKLKKASAVVTKNETYDMDVLVTAADYHHVDTELLPKASQNYSESYWQKRKLAPSCLLYYLGVDKKIDGLLHHNLFFDTDFESHNTSIYDDHTWPENPLFYVCAPSKTDPSVAPEGKENLFLLVPVSTEIEDTEEVRQEQFDLVMNRLEKRLETNIRDHIVYNRSYARSDFMKDYHALKGNAYGLANTLDQTAVLKPRIKSKHLDNHYFAGQLTVPGPGVPPSLISGKIASQLISNQFQTQPS